MDWLQFFSSVIGAIAWPTAIVLSAWLFREKLTELMPLLRLKYKDFEASFRLDQAAKEAAALTPIPLSPESEPTQEERSKFEQIAMLSPRAAMLEVRTDIEEAVRSLAKSKSLLTPKIQSTLGLTRLLRNREIIDHQTSALLDDLRVIGNNAAHAADVSYTREDAILFRTLANNAIAQLRAVETNA